MVEHVTVLKQDEAVRLDPECLKDLYLQLGQPGAQDVVCRAVEELASRLFHVERCYRENRHAEMRKSARSLCTIAEQIGMRHLARVARDVVLSSARNDVPALAATLARLLRLGERSLSEIWDLNDATI